METLRLKINEEDIERAGGIIKEGGLVAFPTETVYGLGADALNAEAVKLVYAAKGRPSDNPMIVHIADIEGLDELAQNISDYARALMEAFWPGPITFVLPKKALVPDTTTGGLDTVAVRMPSNETARKLIRAAKRPIAAPSANISGRPSPTTAEDVLEDMDGRIEAVLMGESCKVGIESTVLDCTGDVPTVLRPGFVTKEMLEEALGSEVAIDAHLLEKPETVLDPEEGAAEADFSPKSPGMKYKHYAPKARVRIVENDVDRYKAEAEASGIRTAVLDYGKNSEEAAYSFFADLRRLDREGIGLILVCALDEEGLGFSIMNRMLKSAGYDVIE
ncbi:MAG: L-threonylcarbamoyladenylate synthase [Firmicutes bacterium]|nr:L-threonylcarbamoyladenylate synthase [Bacillota bacterium]